MAEALYRKYRPQVFKDVVGQDPIALTLKNAVAQDKVSHAYLFTGPRGTGKTTMARLLAKALDCEHGPTPEPCGDCQECNQIAAGNHPDVYELDAASRTGVDNVREEIIGRVNYAPTRGRYKVYIIDEVHMLSTAAFNALLKTLEEPPAHVVFILCTTDPQKVPETIHSRCQRFDFHRIAPETLVSRMGAVCVAEGVDFDGEALDIIAHHANGGMRNALVSLEQVIAYGNGTVTLEAAQQMFGALDSDEMADIIGAIGRFDTAACFIWTDKYVETGADLAQFTRDLAQHIRNMYMMAVAGNDVALDVSDATRRELSAELELFGHERLARIMMVLGDLIGELKTSTNPRLSFEIALTRIAHPEGELTLESLAARIEALEAGVSRAATAAAGVAGAVQSNVAAVADAAQSAAQAGVVGATSAMEAARAKIEQIGARAKATAQTGLQAQQAPQAHTQVQPEVQQQTQPQAQPATQAVPVRDASVKGTTLDLTSPTVLQRAWQSAMTMLKKEKAAYGALFINTRPTYDPATKTLQIIFAPESAFSFKAVQKPEITQTLAQMIANAFGGRVAFQFVLQQGGKAAAGAQTTSATEQPAVSAQAQSAPTVQVAPDAQEQSATTAQPASLESTAVATSQPLNTSAVDDVPPYDDEYDDEPYDFDAQYADDDYDGGTGASFTSSFAQSDASAQPEQGTNDFFAAFGEGLVIEEQ